MTYKDLKLNGMAASAIALTCAVGAVGFELPYVTPGIALIMAFGLVWGERLLPAVFVGTLLSESLSLLLGRAYFFTGGSGSFVGELLFFPVLVTAAYGVVCRLVKLEKHRDLGLTETKDLILFMSVMSGYIFFISIFVTAFVLDGNLLRGLAFLLLEYANGLMLTPLFFYIVSGKFLVLLRASRQGKGTIIFAMALLTGVALMVMSPLTREMVGNWDTIIILPMMFIAIRLGQTVNGIQMAIVWAIGLWDLRTLGDGGTLLNGEVISFAIFLISIGSIIIWVTSISETLKKRSLYLEIQNEIHKENEERILNSEKRLAVIFRSSPIMIILTNMKSGIIVDCNEQTAKNLGFEREEILGMKAMDFGIWETKNDQDTYVDLLKRYGRVTDYEMSIKQKNGEERIFSGSTEPIEIDGASFALTALVDITEKKMNQQRIEKFNEELENEVFQRTLDLNDAKEFNDKVLRNSPVGILTYNSGGQCIIANEAAARITGLTVEELLAYNYLTGGSWEKFGLRDLADYTMKTGESGILEANLEELRGMPVWQEFRTSRFMNNNEEYMLLITSDITARKVSEQALKKAEEQLRSMTNEIPLVVYQGTFQGRHIFLNFINDNAYTMLGVEQNTPITGTLLTNALHPEDREKVIEVFAEASEHKSPWKADFRMIINDRVRWFHTESVPMEMENGEVLWNGYMQDTTERKEAEEDVNLFFKTAVDLMAIKDSAGVFKRLSPSWEEVLGWSTSELIGKAFTQFLHPEDRVNIIEESEKLHEGASGISYIARFRCKDGSYRWLAMNSHNLPERGIRLSVARDMTEAKRLEQVLIEAKNTAESADRAKSEFLANMSHEIRTPLNAVIGFSEILGDQVTDQKQKVYLESINTAGKSLLRLINDILDLSKIEAGMMVMNYSPINPRSIFHELEQIFRIDVDVKGIQFLIEVEENLPKVLVLDEARVRQVLLNLVGNAVKFTDEGFVKIKVVKRNIDPEGKKIDLIIAVQDTGVGINKHELNEVFDSFRQQYGQSDRKYGGTGLGLSISKRLVELMNGRIELESEQGVGSTFTVYLRDISVASFERIEHPESIRERVRFHGEKVLVVDDVESNRELVREQLAMVGLKVYTAFNGEDAIYKVENYHPDLILMDLMMPVMDGEEASREIKGNDSTKDIPIIALTASTRIKGIQENENSPFAGYLSKPVSGDQLYAQVQRFIKGEEIDRSSEPYPQDGRPENRTAQSIQADVSLNPEEHEFLLQELGESIRIVRKGLRRSLVVQIAKDMYVAGEKISNNWMISHAEALKDAINNTDIETATRLIQDVYTLLYKEEKI